MGRALTEVTLDNTTLTIISIVLIAVCSVLFMFDVNQVESRVLLTVCAVGIVVLAYFAGVGFSIVLGQKITATIAWTLPFIILGLGVDDMYIILHSIKKQSGYTEGYAVGNRCVLLISRSIHNTVIT